MSADHTFYFLRHGETGWNKSGTTQGQSDSKLNQTGRAQAERAAEILADKPISRIVASPLSRARHTAEAVAEKHDVPLHFDADLKECHLGDMEGQPHGPWLADYWTGDFDPPNGEPFATFAKRVWQAMSRAIDSGPNTLIVAHGGLWIAALEFVTIDPHLMPLPNGLPLRIEQHGGQWRQQVLSD